jgi:TM2 domain-containing membrane protein YozV
MPFCPKCGNQVSDAETFCPYCGNQLKNTTVTRETPSPGVTVGTKNSGLAAVLSLIIPGLGQMYAGRIGRGLIFFFLGIPLTAIIAVLFFWLIFPLFLPLAFWIWNIFDAYRLCNEYNRHLLQSGTPPW